MTCWIISPQTINKVTTSCWNHRIIALNARPEIPYIQCGLIFQVTALSKMIQTGETFYTYLMRCIYCNIQLIKIYLEKVVELPIEIF